MKTRRFLWVFILVISFIVMCSMLSKGQAMQAEVPGDDFSLEGALELFKKSTSPEDFERQLNSANSRVNNLDLNGDGDIDYIRVIDRNEGNVHAFILQAIVSDRESQDVAVIELEKLANGKAVLQIIGDADVYGMETIIEPTSEVRVNAGTSTSRVVVNVWAWPSVQYVYSPYYVGWVSPWRWSARPMWWRPWRPVAYYTYNPWWQPYRSYYSVCYTHRVGYAQQMYRPMRTTSIVVYNRHHDQISRYRSRQDNDRNYSRNDRGNGNDSRNSDGYDRGNGGRNDSNDRGRSSSTQNGNSSTQSRSLNNQQSEWRSRPSTNQHQRIPARTYSADQMNRGKEQQVNRGFSNQSQQRSRTMDVQRMPENSGRTLSAPGNRTPSVQRGQTSSPSRELGRQNSSPTQSRGQQLSKPSINRGDGDAKRGR